MDRKIIAIGVLSLALPFTASARPAASFNDHPEHYSAAVADVKGSNTGKAARVLPSFNDHAELFAATREDVTTTSSGGSTIVAGKPFNYPAY